MSWRNASHYGGDDLDCILRFTKYTPKKAIEKGRNKHKELNGSLCGSEHKRKKKKHLPAVIVEIKVVYKINFELWTHQNFHLTNCLEEHLTISRERRNSLAESQTKAYHRHILTWTAGSPPRPAISGNQFGIVNHFKVNFGTAANRRWSRDSQYQQYTFRKFIVANCRDVSPIGRAEFIQRNGGKLEYCFISKYLHWLRN